MTVLHSLKIATLADLEEFCRDVRASLTADGVAHSKGWDTEGETTYVSDEPKLSLVKERLTDGSFVYNITVGATS